MIDASGNYRGWKGDTYKEIKQCRDKAIDWCLVCIDMEEDPYRAERILNTAMNLENIKM